MITGAETYHDGRVQAVMNGITAVDNYFNQGDMALDSCFQGLKTIALHNPTDNGWAGTIEITDDGKPTSITCADCTGSTSLTDGDIVVDGNDDSSKLSDSYCQNGATCNLTWEIIGICWVLYHIIICNFDNVKLKCHTIVIFLFRINGLRQNCFQQEVGDLLSSPPLKFQCSL